jgi:hypothetical protein
MTFGGWEGGRCPAAILVMLSVAFGCGDDDGPSLAGASGPLLLAPAQGEGTGTVWSERAVRPRFSWTMIAGAAHYEVQIDDACSLTDRCDFSSPDVAVSVVEPSFVPSPLAVGMEAPVGRRYFWRVRACDASECTNWSAVWYVDVGRQRSDFNGDGYGDLVVTSAGGPRVGGGVFVYFGGRQISDAAGWRYQGAGFAEHFEKGVWIGDMDGDGFADLALVSASEDASSGQSVQVFRGGRDPESAPALGIQDGAFVSLLANASDVNGDGLADLYFQSIGDGVATDHVVFGANPLPGTVTTEIRIPTTSRQGVIGACDFDGDGYSDLVRKIETPGSLEVVRGRAGTPPAGLTVRSVRADVHLDPLACMKNFDRPGGATLLLTGAYTLSEGYSVANVDDPPFRLQAGEPSPTAVEGCDGQLPAPAVPMGAVLLGRAASVGDLDGDGKGDMALGDSLNRRVVVYFGGCPVTKSAEIPGPSSPERIDVGFAVGAPGDVDGDGFDDLAYSVVRLGLDGLAGGEVRIHRGGASLGAEPVVLTHPSLLSEDGFGAWLD